MQNSNLSSNIFPIIKEDWSIFIKKVEKDLQEMMVTYNNDKRRIKDLERLISKLKEVFSLSKDNIEEIFNYKELFMYIDNSLEDSFDALNFFKENGNFDNSAVKSIYEKILTSSKIIKINSEYSRLRVKIPFDNERIKKLSELIRGNKIDYNLIRELLNKYKLDDNKKKNILFYTVVMLSIRQNEIKKDSQDSKNQDKKDFYNKRFNELVKKYQEMKENFKELLIRCFNVRKKMSYNEVNMYNTFSNNPDESLEYNYDNESKFKIYTLAFFKVKKEIESYIDGISDLIVDMDDLDDEMVFFNEMINDFNNIANTLNGLIIDSRKKDNEFSNNVYLALDPFNRVIIQELLTDKNMNNIEALLQKTDNISEEFKTNHMQEVENEEKLLGKNIFTLTTSKMKLAYITINKNVLIIGGSSNEDKFNQIIRLAVNRNLYSLRNQISLIEKEDLAYIELQNRIISNIVGEKEKAI